MKKHPIDEFYQTEYTFTLADDICLFYNHNYCNFICLQCNEKHVEIKKDVIDYKQPLFGIFRKKYCMSCWLEIFNAKYKNN
jgi:hypothetical protein